MPLQETSGAATYDAFGGKAVAPAPAVNYIEDVFNLNIYSGNGTNQSIANGIDFATQGGLVWIKSQNTFGNHALFDTARGAGTSSTTNRSLQTNNSNPENYDATDYVSAFNTNGFTVNQGGSAVATQTTNTSGCNYVALSFRKQAKFFDVVTYTGNGTAGRTVAHNLGSVPGMMIIKSLSSYNWWVYHRSWGNGVYSVLNSSTSSPVTSALAWNNTTPTSTVFTLGNGNEVNGNGFSFVAYLFAHDAGGFGLSGTDNVISCGSYTEGSALVTVNVGFEPQYLLVKRFNAGSDWFFFDILRGMNWTAALGLRANTVDTNTNYGDVFRPTPTGFLAGPGFLGNGNPFIYVAIRRGPMKEPTSADSVFGLVARSGTGANATVDTGQLADCVLIKNRGAAVADVLTTRLQGLRYFETNTNGLQLTAAATILQSDAWAVNTGIKIGTTGTNVNATSNTYINYIFKRAPKFMDVVLYRGTNVARDQNHGLTVAPQLIIVKDTALNENWQVYSQPTGTLYRLIINSTAARETSTIWRNQSPTATLFGINEDQSVNGLNITYVAYLFATVAGISKVGSYTGTGTTAQQIDCGFTNGARFVMIKRFDSTGDWYYWDTARGIVAGDDPYLLLNSLNAEVTNTDYIDPYSAGFEISSTAPAGINASGGSFLYLAIA